MPTEVEQRSIQDDESDNEIVIQNNYDEVNSTGDDGIKSRDEDSTPQPEDRPTNVDIIYICLIRDSSMMCVYSQ